MDKKKRSDHAPSEPKYLPDIGRRNLLKWTPGVITAGILLSPDRAPAEEEERNVKRASPINVKDFGAVGDGKTDDSPAIRNAMDFASSKGIGTVKVPAGNYALGSSLPIHDGVHVRGDSPEATRLKSTGDFPVFKEIREANNPVRGGGVTGAGCSYHN